MLEGPNSHYTICGPELNQEAFLGLCMCYAITWFVMVKLLYSGFLHQCIARIIPLMKLGDKEHPLELQYFQIH